MSVWLTVIGTAAGMVLGGPLGALAGAAAGGAMDIAAQRLRGPERRRVAFTVAVIALAAKMARADGQATAAEFAAFERLFQVPAGEAGNTRRFYDLAKQSVAGFEAYADQAARLLGQGSPVLEDLLEALWLIAAVDGVDPLEIDYLDTVAIRFGIDAATQARIRARHFGPAEDDPWVVLEVAPGADAATLRQAYHRLAKRYHPDRHLAEGVPAEFIRVAEARLAAINDAYARLTGRN